MKTTFNLISKIQGQKFVEYKGNIARLSTQIPYTVDEIVLAAKNKPRNKRRITTFRDSNNNIIERIFDYIGRPIKNQVYSYQEHVLGEDEYITSKTMKEYIISRSAMKDYRNFDEEMKKLGIETFLWERTTTRTDHVSRNINTDETIVTRTQIKNNPYSEEEEHIFIEFPHITNGKVKIQNPKMLFFKVNKHTKEYIQASEIKDGVCMPANDSFLGFRAMDLEDSKEPLTRRFIQERGLQGLPIIINTQYSPQIDEQNLIAFYQDSDGSINFNKFYPIKSKSKLASTARHEVEHFWQYFLRTLFTGGKDKRRIELAKKYKTILRGGRIKEARQYTRAIGKYVPYNQDYQKYKNNLIERRARQEGLDAKNRYEHEGYQISQSFPHIPPEML